ncbi:Uncharacterised protein [uncultured archaeon]|nr:Uncharacterised protein [uncultured archaeon]
MVILDKERIEEAVRRELQLIDICPQYENCITGKAMSEERCSINCRIYGCSVSGEHSVLQRVYSELNVNGDMRQRRQVIQVIRDEVTDGKYQFRKH